MCERTNCQRTLVFAYSRTPLASGQGNAALGEVQRLSVIAGWFVSTSPPSGSRHDQDLASLFRVRSRYISKR
jgi:hypothetical protein